MVREDPYALQIRSGLPDALRVLADAYPRGKWQEHENFGEMVRFWMDRHAMFRDLSARLEAEARSYVAGETGIEAYAPRLSRLGGFFLQQLHGHHQIEDFHYFPQLVRLDARLARGFDMLERDHEAIDPMLQDFAEAANRVLAGAQNGGRTEEAGKLFQERMSAFAVLLERHLTDEEDLVVPVILKTGFAG